MTKKRIAFVVPRYGPNINGGAETLCREYAESLVADFDVTVLTTCAEDYTTWENRFSEGRETINGVQVIRFKTAPRASDFDSFTPRILADKNNKALAEEWMKKQGPYSTDLIDYIATHADQYDHFLFVPYLYATTYFGVQKVYQKAILIPATHDEPMIYFSIFDEVFKRVQKIIFLTPEEREFALKRFKTLPSNKVIGMGIDLPKTVPVDLDRFQLPKRYAIYVGRIDPSKGCQELVNYYETYSGTKDLSLVFIGKKAMDLPPDIHCLGFVEESEKHALIERAEFGILPSRYESFSISLLEYYAHKKPVIVNGHSAVLKGHCLRGNGGLWYQNQAEWETAVRYLMTHPEEAKIMGNNGYEYVKKSYQKKKVAENLKQFLMD